MGAFNLSNGVVMSITRGAQMRTGSGNAAVAGGMTLLDKMSLLRTVAEHPPEDLGGLLEQLRRGRGGMDVFSRLRAMMEDGGLVEAAPAFDTT